MRQLLHRLLLAAFFTASPTVLAHAQAVAPPRGLHDSITVTTVTYVGAKDVSPDDIRCPR